jgi:hypothetical protein
LLFFIPTVWQGYARRSSIFAINPVGWLWNFSDTQIVAAFQSWLKKARPSGYSEPDAIGKTTGISWQQLPFGKRTALEYLGVHRRKETCTWPDYLERWATQAQLKRPDSTVRQLKAQCAKAKEIIQTMAG